MSLLPPGGLPGLSRTIVLRVGMQPDTLALPAKDALDVLPWAVDLTATLTDLSAAAGTAVTIGAASGIIVTADPSLTVGAVTVAGGVLKVASVGGGASGASPMIAVLVPLLPAGQIEIGVVQPITGPTGAALPAAVAGGYLVLPSMTTLAGIADATTLTGAEFLARQDGTLVTVPVGLLPSGGGSLSSPAPGGAVFTAGGAISGHRVLMFDGIGNVVQADPASADYAFAGLSVAAAASGTSVSVAGAGDEITEPTWAWTPAAALYAGVAGALTQAPPASGWLQQVAVAVTATSILVQPYTPVFRS